MTSGGFVSVEALDRATCWGLAHSVPLGRVAMIRRRHPIILPVNFVVADTRIVYRTASGTDLAPYQNAEDVAFEIDGIDEERRLGWSVLIVGRATVLRDADEIARLAGRLETWAPGDRDLVVQIRPQEITGRQVVRTSGERLVGPR